MPKKGVKMYLDDDQISYLAGRIKNNPRYVESDEVKRAGYIEDYMSEEYGGDWFLNSFAIAAAIGTDDDIFPENIEEILKGLALNPIA